MNMRNKSALIEGMNGEWVRKWIRSEQMLIGEMKENELVLTSFGEMNREWTLINLSWKVTMGYELKSHNR